MCNIQCVVFRKHYYYNMYYSMTIEIRIKYYVSIVYSIWELTILLHVIQQTNTEVFSWLKFNVCVGIIQSKMYYCVMILMAICILLRESNILLIMMCVYSTVVLFDIIDIIIQYSEEAPCVFLPDNWLFIDWLLYSIFPTMTIYSDAIVTIIDLLSTTDRC